MNKYNQVFKKLAGLLNLFLILALSILGILLIILMFKELIPIGQAIFQAPSYQNTDKILDGIIVFFLFFEFVAMVIMALANKGHTSLEYLMGLGATALLRELLTTHTAVEKTIWTTVAILLLIVGIVIYHKNIKE